MIFFFQAEDGIRELVRSRGLGDVYKRQDLGIESIGELLYACQENRLLKLKGFGQKLQDEVLSLIHI